MSKGVRLGRLAALVAVLGGVFLCDPTPAHSQGNLDVGPFRILLNVDASGTYDDNIELSPTNKQSDFIWDIAPGITVELPGRRSALRVAYRADILQYTEHSEFDIVEHTAKAEGRYEFPWGLSVQAGDDFTHSQQFTGTPTPELTQLTVHNDNTFRAGGRYQFPGGRFALGVDYNWFLTRYDESEFKVLDRDDHTIGATLYYKFMPKTSLLAEYDYQIVRYKETNQPNSQQDSDSQFVKVGIQGDLTAKTAATIKAGYQMKDYSNPAVKDFDGFVFEGEVIWKYRDPSQLRLYGGRANVESVFVSQNYYVTNYGGIEVRHYLSPRFIVKLTGLAGVSDYPSDTTIGTQTAKRSDTFYNVGIGLQYFVYRWLTLVLEYERQYQDSNFDVFDYTGNRVTGTIRLTY